jgi:hypothetical protein
MRNIHFLFSLLLCSCQALLSQEKFEVSHPQFYKIPSKELPSEIDLSAKAKGNFTADSFYFDVYVKDDHITNQDRIDIWFGSPWSDFSDYIVGEKNKKTFIFRNSAESGDEANLQRFIQDADYPKGKLKNAESGQEIKPIVPEANNLKREYIFNGITRFEFSSNQKTTSAQMLALTDAKKDYEQTILLNLFDFTIIDYSYISSIKILSENTNSFKQDAVEQFKNIDVEIKTLLDIAVKFKTQLSQLFDSKNEPNAESFLQTRIIAGAAYLKKAVENIKSKIEKTTLETDSRTISSELNKSIGLFHKEICFKIFLLEGVEKGFEISIYLEHKRKFQKSTFLFNSYAGASNYDNTSLAHPALYKKLRKKRDDICAQKNTPIYLVASSNTLEEMSSYLPQTEHDLNLIKGFGPIKTKQYGNQFLDIIREYCEENGLSSILNLTTKKATVVKKGDAEKKKKEKSDTKQVSFNLFKSGKNIEEIALERNLTPGTIETHLIYFIENNQIELSEILSAEKI